MIFLSPLVDVIRMSRSTVSFFALLDSGAFLLTYDLNGSKSRVNRHPSFTFLTPLFSPVWVLFLTLRHIKKVAITFDCFFSELLRKSTLGPTPRPIFFCYTCNTKFGMEMPDTYDHVIGRWKISESLPDLNLGVKKSKCSFLLLWWTSWTPTTCNTNLIQHQI